MLRKLYAVSQHPNISAIVTDEVVARLRASEAEDDHQRFAEEAGRDWAARYAEHSELRRLACWHAGTDWFRKDDNAAYSVAETMYFRLHQSMRATGTWRSHSG
jgi:flagellar biosynthesis/type III secretory pathway ATPase